MSRSNIHFFNEDVSYRLRSINAIRNWIESTVASEGAEIIQINYVFCSDAHLLNINREFLNHDYYTDIITFPYSHSTKELEADIYISTERVKENAAFLKCSAKDELHRVIIHGILHLLGYNENKEM
jgi:rRNA maturation RNase YbeY